jgi:hypothetical protein
MMVFMKRFKLQRYPSLAMVLALVLLAACADAI